MLVSTPVQLVYTKCPTISGMKSVCPVTIFMMMIRENAVTIGIMTNVHTSTHINLLPIIAISVCSIHLNDSVGGVCVGAMETGAEDPVSKSPPSTIFVSNLATGGGMATGSGVGERPVSKSNCVYDMSQ